jgi:riboflavin transporter FmnP
MKTTKINTRYVAVTAMLSAVATVLMYLEFSVPIMPGFIKLDVSELPALIASFSMGPISGLAVCLVKNLIKLFFTSTAGVGELCNFLLGACFVVPAGIIYSRRKTFKGAIIAGIVGMLCMAVLSLPINYFISYPFYETLMPREAIIGMYQAILPSVNSLFECLLVFNVPFTFVKGLIDCIITFLIYKRISPLIHGKK